MARSIDRRRRTNRRLSLGAGTTSAAEAEGAADDDRGPIRKVGGVSVGPPMEKQPQLLLGIIILREEQRFVVVIIIVVLDSGLT